MARRQKMHALTEAALRDLPVGHQYNNFVRVTAGDALFHLRDGRAVLRILPGELDGAWVDSGDFPSRGGRYFVYYGDRR